MSQGLNKVEGCYLLRVKREIRLDLPSFSEGIHIISTVTLSQSFYHYYYCYRVSEKGISESFCSDHEWEGVILKVFDMDFQIYIGIRLFIKNFHRRTMILSYVDKGHTETSTETYIVVVQKCWQSFTVVLAPFFPSYRTWST